MIFFIRSYWINRIVSEKKICVLGKKERRNNLQLLFFSCTYSYKNEYYLSLKHKTKQKCDNWMLGSQKETFKFNFTWKSAKLEIMKKSIFDGLKFKKFIERSVHRFIQFSMKWHSKLLVHFRFCDLNPS